MAGRLPQIPDWPAPKTLGHLLQWDKLIEPADEEFSADFSRLGLHLDDLEQNVKVDAGGQVVVPEPVEAGLIWWGGESHRRTLRWSPRISYSILISSSSWAIPR
jgi:hypothetical protein